LRLKAPLKIVHIIGDLRTGGAEAMLCKLLSGMDRRRFDPVVISLRNRGDLGTQMKDLKVPVHVIGMSGVPTLNKLWRLIRLVKQLEPDVIQGWMYHGNLAAQLTGAFSGKEIPVVWNIRQSNYSLKDEKPLTAAMIWLNARLSGLPTKLVNNSKESARLYEEKLSFNGDKWVIIPNGFDLNDFAPSAAARTKLRQKLGLAENTFLFGMVARYHQMKDHETFLKAASSLLRTNSDVHFVLAGGDVISSNEELSGLIGKLGIQENVHLLGERNDIAQVTAALDVATLSSAYGEGFPNVIGEAMACEVPCVITDVGDSASIVGETGIVVRPRDTNSLAEGWFRLLHMDQDQRRALGILARQRIENLFSLSAIARQYESLYEEVIANGGRGAPCGTGMSNAQTVRRAVATGPKICGLQQ
jgi:glycosyltransferase involved in cell wall biosynthesis